MTPLVWYYVVKYLVGPLLRRVNLRPHKPYHGVPDLTVSVSTLGAIIFDNLKDYGANCRYTGWKLGGVMWGLGY